MLRVYRTYLLLGLLTCAATACSDASDPRDDDGDAQRSTDHHTRDDAQDQAGDAEDEPEAAGSTRDAGAAPRPDAAAYAGDADASAAPGDAATARPDAAVADAGTTSASVCPETDGWDAQAAAFEEQVLTLTNAARAAGHNCDSQGNFGPTGPLKMQNQLRCAARLHTQYMASTGDFNHTQTATGKDPGARLRDVGYRASTWGENIAWGQRTPQEVVSGWLDSDGHCANIMNPAFTEIGVGYAVGSRSGRQAAYWTQDFGRTR